MASYCYGLGKTALKYKTLPQMLDERAVKNPKKTAYVIHQMKENEDIFRSSVTFEELAQRSELVGAGFLKLGIRAGEHVGIMAANSLEYLYVDCACLKIKALLNRIPNRFLESSTICSFLQKYNIRTLVIDCTNRKTLEQMFPGFLELEIRQNVGLGFVEKILFVEDCTEKCLFLPESQPGLDTDVQRVKDIQKTCDPDDFAVMFCTSGSTGRPKCVLHSHFSQINVLSYYDEGTIVSTQSAFHWSGGLVYGPIAAGITLVYVDTHIYTIQGRECIYQIMKGEGVNTCTFLPSLLFETKRRHEEGIRTFRPGCRLQLTGELITSDLELYIKQQFDEYCSTYGSVELFHTLDTMGKGNLTWYSPLPHVEAKITDDKGQVVPRGTIGVLKIRSPFTLITYLGTESVKDNAGWFTTNDLTEMDDEGRILLLGRNNEVISKDGVKIYPKTVENLLLNQPNVEKAAVVPVSDPKSVQEICAFILLKPGSKSTEEDIRQFCSLHTFDNSKIMIPKYIKILEDFPYGSTGKVDKSKLKQLASDQFGVFM